MTQFVPSNCLMKIQRNQQRVTTSRCMQWQEQKRQAPCDCVRWSGTMLLLLVDSGSTHTFVNSAFALRAECMVQDAEPVTVRVANGDTLQSNQQVAQLQWWCQGNTFSIDMRLLDLGAYDAVLGVDWLARFSPMNCHWGLKTMEFRHDNVNIKLQGVRSPTVPTLNRDQSRPIIQVDSGK